MNNMTDGVLTVISGFAGAGKGTIVNYLISEFPDIYALSISATTRKPREGEKDGREYFFLEKEEFEKKISQDEFIEYAKYVDNYYGTPKDYVLTQLKNKKDVILEIEVQGALSVKKAFPQALLLFVTPPSASILEQRLKGRGTETDQVIKKRMKRAYEESQLIDNYDYLIINDEIDKAALKVHHIIRNEHLSTSANRKFINDLSLQLKEYAK